MTLSPNDERYTDHALCLLDSIQSLKSDEVLFDFTIKVEDESFQAHRLVLAANSQYFRAMLSHDVVESREGKVDVKDVRAHAMKECLEFMYTSQFSVDISTVEDILRLADMLQLSRVTESCMNFLADNLNSSNCIFVLKLLELFPHEALQKSCVDIVKISFNDVIISNDFKQLSLVDAKKYISECNSGDDTIWNATVSWIEHDEDDRGEAAVEFVKLLKFIDFPPYLMLREMWSKTWFTGTEDAKVVVLQNIFRDKNYLSDNLNVDNCYFLKQLAESYEHTSKDANMQVILTFLKRNLDQIMTRDDFVQYSKEIVFFLLSSADAEYLTSESSKWNAMIKWLKHNDGNDNVFLDLLPYIDFNLLSVDFIKTVVRNARLVKKYVDDDDLVFNIIGNHGKTRKSFLVLLHEKVKKIDLCTKACTILPTQSVTPYHVTNLNNNLCVLSGQRLFHFLKDKSWIEKASLQRRVSRDAKLVVCAECLYVVDRNSMSKYDPARNEWDENLTSCPVQPDCVSASDTHIYAMSSWQNQPNVVQYHLDVNQWHVFCRHPGVTSFGICIVDSILYSLNKGSVTFYNTLAKMWICETNRPHGTSEMHIFEINGSLAVYGKLDDSYDFLDIYDPKYNWIRTTFSSAGGLLWAKSIVPLSGSSLPRFPMLSSVGMSATAVES